MRTARQVIGFAAVMILELGAGIRLIGAPHAGPAVDMVATAMIASVASGIDRAWGLVGGHRTTLTAHLGDLFAPGDAADSAESPDTADSADRARPGMPQDPTPPYERTDPAEVTGGT